MPEEIRRQLQRLGVRRGRDLPAPARPDSTPVPLAGLEGRAIDTGAGSCFVVEKEYALSSQHGCFPLAAFLSEPLEHLTALATSAPIALAPSALAFLDIETTGLSDGAGTYAFLVGLGRFAGDTFCLYQVFLRSPLEEQAMLQVVAELLDGVAGLVTFNGRGFDLPILSSRYTMARMQPPWEGKAHLDLLFPVRRLWRTHLPSCSLSSLERHLLGVERNFLDIPGWRIPSVYRDYLCGADASVLQPIFHHNAYDVLSLVTLGTRLARFLRDPWGDGGARHGLEFGALGRLYEQQGEIQAATAAYRAALLLAMPVEERERTWERLSFLLKRQGAWEEAVEIWEALVERPGVHPLYAYVELSKYCEHRCGDIARAEGLVRRAIAEHGEQAGGEDLAHRLGRLQRKGMKRGA